MSDTALTYIFFFNDTATTEIYTLSLHDALPISVLDGRGLVGKIAAHGIEGDENLSRIESVVAGVLVFRLHRADNHVRNRSEEHTSELQSQSNLVCRLLLEKKNNKVSNPH